MEGSNPTRRPAPRRRYSVELGCASLCAHRSYAVGDEVHDSYGPSLSPSQLLLDYGFVDEANNNHRVDLDPAAIGVACACLLA